MHFVATAGNLIVLRPVFEDGKENELGLDTAHVPLN